MSGSNRDKSATAITVRLPRVDRPAQTAPMRFWDDRVGAWSVSVLPGEVYVTDEDECLTTVLGSCVSACVRHPGTRTGGMNHLVLPDAARASPGLTDDRVSSLDRLVSGVLASGGRADELEIKVFGGGRVISGASDIGKLNIAAVRTHFASRGLAIAIEDVGGGVARRLRYQPRTGRVLLQRLVMRDTNSPSTP
jgi:chemotaxis protein CheD